MAEAERAIRQAKRWRAGAEAEVPREAEKVHREVVVEEEEVHRGVEVKAGLNGLGGSKTRTRRFPRYSPRFYGTKPASSGLEYGPTGTSRWENC